MEAIRYFFPGPLTDTQVGSHILPQLRFHVGSGRDALRLFIRSYNLRESAVIAIPAFACELVKEAVLMEKCVPLELDLKSDSTFWTDYHTHDPALAKVDALILVHLYGFMHPDTNEIVSFCKSRNIKLLHDAAQNFGSDFSPYPNADVIYSFGPGKSSTAALGAFLNHISPEYYAKHVKRLGLWNNFLLEQKSKLFIRSRLAGIQLSKLDSIRRRLVYFFLRGNRMQHIQQMSLYQQRAGSKVVSGLHKYSVERSKRYQLLANSLQGHSHLHIPYDDGKGLYFKMIVFVNGDTLNFAQYLSRNQVPFFRLFTELQVKNQYAHLKQFSNVAFRFFEFSTESSIPMSEISRIGEVLMNYKD